MIPVIGRSDSLTPSELRDFKRRIMEDIEFVSSILHRSPPRVDPFLLDLKVLPDPHLQLSLRHRGRRRGDDRGERQPEEEPSVCYRRE